MQALSTPARRNSGSLPSPGTPDRSPVYTHATPSPPRNEDASNFPRRLSPMPAVASAKTDDVFFASASPIDVPGVGIAAGKRLSVVKASALSSSNPDGTPNSAPARPRAAPSESKIAGVQQKDSPNRLHRVSVHKRGAYIGNCGTQH